MIIVVALSRFPYPVLKGDKLRAYYLLQELARHHELHLVCTSYETDWQQHLQELTAICKSVQVVQLPKWRKAWNAMRALISGKPLQAEYFVSPAARKAVADAITRTRPNVGLVQLIRMTENIPAEPSLPWVLDYMDNISSGIQNRLSQVAWYMRPFIWLEGRRAARYEAAVAQRFSACTIISEADKHKFPSWLQPKLFVVPNGVPEKFFAAERLPWASREYDVMFTGNMSYFPNSAAAIFLAQEVMPLVWKQTPAAKVAIVGTDPGPEVRALASERVLVTGFVPNLLAYLLKAKVFSAPLFSGAGVQNKLLEAMAAGVPAITSPMAAQALGATHAEVGIAQNAEGFASKIIALLDNPEGALHMGTAGKAFVQAQFKWEQAAKVLRNVLENAAKQAGG